MTIPRLIAGALLMLAATAGQAFDYKTVGPNPVILYDAPSTKGGKLFIVPRGAPLEVVLTYGDWAKVRDVSGELAWTEAKGLTGKRAVIVRTPGLKVRATPDDAGTPVFSADKGVLLELAEPANGGWLKVRHKDGPSGYVKSGDVWGD